jgi:hypothetical protein
MICCPREWDGISAEQKKYLVKIRPPGDVISRIIRQIVVSKAISAAAVIHDDTICETFALYYSETFYCCLGGVV